MSAKLDALAATLDLLRVFDADAIAGGLSEGAGRHALAIGSGGSAVAAEFLARCRDTLGLGPTGVQTPMQAVLDVHDLSGSDVWLFSAGGDNPDIVAATEAAFDRGATRLHLVTRNPDGAACRFAVRGGGRVHVVPVADGKDGYLATHSLLSFTTALLLASDTAGRDAHGATPLLDAIAARLAAMRDPVARGAAVGRLAGFRREDVLILAMDPLLRPLAVLLDTSAWEASLCAVQIADFRNFAHGRHAWLHHRAAGTVMLALTGVESREVWAAIDAALPADVRRLASEHGSCGRLENLLALVDGFGIVEALGEVLGVDPGKPGIGDFGRAVYDDASLATVASALPPRVRHKRAAIARSDAFDTDADPLHAIGRARLEALAEARIGGAVFDYDGTIVTTEGRWSVPDAQIVDELVRLFRAGLQLGIATGRGGSAGEDLRKVLPADILPAIPIGYYNGGYLRPADVRIEDDPPPWHPDVTETAAWLGRRQDLFTDFRFRHRGPQITVDMDTLARPYRFPLDLEACPAFRDGRVRVLGSGHSYDVVPTASTKMVVVAELERSLPPGDRILCFGDSGSRRGNDHALLSHPHGISVGEVCGASNGCWSLFGGMPTGPSALLKILRALIPDPGGWIRLDIASLGIDSRREART